jgi:integrase
MTCGDVDFGRPTITVIGKGSREQQIVPISPDAVVWIRLYLAEGLVAPVDQPLPLNAPLWVTRRRPIRPLNYNALRRVLQRANDQLGANTTLHDLRHTYASWLKMRGIASDATFGGLWDCGATRTCGFGLAVVTG